MKYYIYSLILSIALISNTHASSNDLFNITINKSANNAFFFEKCEDQDCYPLGGDRVYTVAQLMNLPSYSNLTNSLYLGGEVVAGAAVFGCAGAPLVCVIVVGGLITIINWGEDSGPIDNFEKTYLSNRVEKFLKSDEESMIIYETDDLDDYFERVQHMTRMLKEVM